MKKNKKLEHNEDHKQEIEILKAVAQAWHAHSSSSRPTSEFDAYRRNSQCKPSQFKLEAISKSSVKGAAGAKWDFRQSLWDSYEIVTVSKRLERGLVLDNLFTRSGDDQSRVHRRQRESKNSLRNLFNLMSSRRFNEVNIPRDDNAQL